MNLAALVTDPAMGAVPFAYGRITERVTDRGRATFSEQRHEAVGCIQPAPGKEREVLEEADRQKAALLIFTPAPLITGAGTGEGAYKADRVYYAGGVYRVALVEPWGSPGAYVKAIAVLEEPQ